MAARPRDHERDLAAQRARRVAGDKVLVTGIKGRLVAGWQHKVETFAARIPIQG